MNKFVKYAFYVLFCATWLAPLLVFREYLFPYITSKAFSLRILVELTLPFYIYLIVAYKELRPNLKNPIVAGGILFLVISLFAGFFGVNPLKSFWGNFERMGGVYYLAHLTLLMFYTLCLCQMGKTWVKAALWGMLGSAIFVTIYGWGIWMGLDKAINSTFGPSTVLPDPTLPRISSTLGNPIFFASMLILPIFLALFLLVREKRPWLRTFLTASVGLMLVGVYMSTTRGAILGMAVGVFFALLAYIYFTGSPKLRRYGSISAGVLIVVIGLLYTFSSSLPQGPFRRLFTLRDGNTFARIIQWKAALTGFSERPLLGVGPENYAVVSNGHYNPVMYNYDPSWFDKPHNYQLEVLVTTGIFGFLAYLTLVFGALYAAYRAYRAGVITLVEFCAIIAGVITYQVQNIFVFDTISASMTFFSATGFFAYLWYAADQAALPETEKRTKVYVSPVPMEAMAGGLVVLLLVMWYVVYATNLQGIAVAKNINYGYAYQGASPQKSLEYFEAARTQGLNFDPVEMSGKYTEVAVNMTSNLASYPQNKDIAQKMTEGAIAAMAEAESRVKTDPTLYQRFASLLVSKALQEKTGLDPRAEVFARRAYELATERPEPQLNLVRLLLLQNKVEESVKILEHVSKTIPKQVDARMQLAFIYNATGKKDEGVALGRQAIADGYAVRQLRDVDWIATTLLAKGEVAEGIALYEKAFAAAPSEVNTSWSLAKSYAKIGDREKAAAYAQNVVKLEPAQKQQVIDFLKTLQ